MSSAYIAKSPDLIVFVGARDMGGRVLPNTAELPPGARIVRIGIDTASMGRNYPTDLALIGDVKESLTDLMSALQNSLAKDSTRNMVKERSAEIRSVADASRSKTIDAMKANFGHAPM